MPAEFGSWIRHASILATPVALLCLACGDEGPTAPPPEILNTASHSESGGTWPEYSISISNISWRLISLDTNGVRGSYNLTWLNEGQTPTLVSHELRFFDSSNFQIDRYASWLMPTVLEPGIPRPVSGNFTLNNVASIAAANSITEMQVWASFQPHDLAVTTETLPSGTVWIYYSAPLNASGGAGSYSWSIRSGSLPAGLTIGVASGTIYGTPASAGTSTFAVEVTSGWQTATRELSITIH